jgi:hypothetical protein
MSKRFTLTEAESLLPELELVMREAVSLKAQRQEAEQALQSFAERVAMQGGVMVDRETVLQNRARLNRSGERLKEARGEEPQPLSLGKGAFGLVDFPTLFRAGSTCAGMGEADSLWHVRGGSGTEADRQEFWRNRGSIQLSQRGSGELMTNFAPRFFSLDAALRASPLPPQSTSSTRSVV